MFLEREALSHVLKTLEESQACIGRGRKSHFSTAVRSTSIIRLRRRDEWRMIGPRSGNCMDTYQSDAVAEWNRPVAPKMPCSAGSILLSLRVTLRILSSQYLLIQNNEATDQVASVIVTREKPKSLHPFRLGCHRKSSLPRQPTGAWWA